ncbi:ADP-ribosyltransferase [Mycobacterium ahvazicum]|uniref:ADP-ribosyltransferase n=1 Tax=Mycobacterium ahvazicum TaxID=1964395 RepID=UPI001FAF8AC6|nr:ADP-ribosyltransferase [Mycobacterium ahvazicum]
MVTAAEGLASVISTLTAALSGCAGMAGDDPAGAALGRDYDRSAAKLIEAMVSTRNGLCSLGNGVRMSAHNYSLAEAMSNVGGNGGTVPPPPSSGFISAGHLPSSLGNSDSAPPGWGWVAPYLGMIWPSGDSAKLRAAATAWTAAGTQFALGEILGTGTAMGVIRAQQLPEASLVENAFTDAYSRSTRLVQQCQRIASQLSSYAAKIDKVHAAILDLLSRICDPLTGFKEVWDILTDEDEDEIRKIANDIRTVIDNFNSEVKALEAEIASALAEAEAIVTTMGNYAAKQWDQFLHGTDVGRIIGRNGHGGEEFLSEAAEFVEGALSMSQLRLLFDPVGFYHDSNDMVRGALPLAGLGPEGSPSVQDSWKALGKDVSHWDQWQTDPVGAAGRTLFDGLTLALPGGPLSRLGTRGRAALDAIKGLKKPPLPEPLDRAGIKPPETPKPPVERPKPPPTGPKPPEPGSPAPTPKPGPAPAGTAPPHSPTEPKPPAGKTPKPTAPPPTSGGKPPASAPAEAPQPHEHVPTTPSENPGELAQKGANPSAPHPPSVPTGSGPGEAPVPHGGAPHMGEPGPHGPHQPNGATPHLPDGGSPHHPGEGTPYPPADGSPLEPGDGSGHPHSTIPLTPADIAALTDYTGPGYQELNDVLRNGALDASHQARVDAINRALEKLPAYQGPVIRGTSLPTEVLDRYQPGRVITEPAFTSTTTLRAVAEGPAFGGNVEFRIFSLTGRDISSFSMYPGEKEVLFPPGSKFYVENRTVDPRTGRTIIEMIER